MGSSKVDRRALDVSLPREDLARAEWLGGLLGNKTIRDCAQLIKTPRGEAFASTARLDALRFAIEAERNDEPESFCVAELVRIFNPVWQAHEQARIAHERAEAAKADRLVQRVAEAREKWGHAPSCAGAFGSQVEREFKRGDAEPWHAEFDKTFGKLGAEEYRKRIAAEYRYDDHHPGYLLVEIVESTKRIRARGGNADDVAALRAGIARGTSGEAYRLDALADDARRRMADLATAVTPATQAAATAR